MNRTNKQIILRLIVLRRIHGLDKPPRRAWRFDQLFLEHRGDPGKDRLELVLHCSLNLEMIEED